MTQHYISWPWRLWLVTCDASIHNICQKHWDGEMVEVFLPQNEVIWDDFFALQLKGIYHFYRRCLSTLPDPSFVLMISGEMSLSWLISLNILGQFNCSYGYPWLDRRVRKIQNTSLLTITHFHSSPFAFLFSWEHIKTKCNLEGVKDTSKRC